MTRPIALYLISLFNVVFTTQRLVQIIVVLGATVAMKWLAIGYDAGWASASTHSPPSAPATFASSPAPAADRSN